MPSELYAVVFEYVGAFSRMSISRQPAWAVSRIPILCAEPGWEPNAKAGAANGTAGIAGGAANEHYFASQNR